MQPDRRKADLKTWIYRGLIALMAGFCSIMLGVTYFCGKGWIESWLQTIATQNAAVLAQVQEIKRNTEDYPLYKFKTETMWQASNFPKTTPLPPGH